MKKVSVLIATILVTASVVLAENFNKDFLFEPTDYGNTMSARGQGAMGEQDGQQYFIVLVNALVPDGTVMVVVVNNGRRSYIAGTVTIESAQGILSLSSPDPNGAPGPRGVFPVQEIQWVRVADANGVCLVADPLVFIEE
jgi:hypothetical protein